AGHFLEFNRARLGLRGLRLSYAAERALLAYAWPGNVRELEHVISRAALKMLTRGASRDQILTLGPELLDVDAGRPGAAQDLYEAEPFYGAEGASGPTGEWVGGASTGGIQPLRQTLENTQKACIQRALDAAGGNWAHAARMLDIDASNLHKIARKLGLKES